MAWVHNVVMCDTGTWQVNTTLVSDRFTRPRYTRHRFTRPRYTTCLTGHLWHSTDCGVPGIPKSWQTKLPKKYLTQVDDRPDPNYDVGKLYDTRIWHITAQVWQVSAVQLWHVRQGRRAPGRLLHRPRFPKSWPGFEAAAVSPSRAVGRTRAFHFLKSVNIVTDVVIIIIIQMIVNIAIEVLFHLDWCTNKCSCQGVFIGNGFSRSDLLLLSVLNDLISAFIKNSVKIIVTINILIIEDVFSSSIYSLSNTCN